VVSCKRKKKLLRCVARKGSFFHFCFLHGGCGNLTCSSISAHIYFVTCNATVNIIFFILYLLPVSSLGSCESQPPCEHLCLPRINAVRECACAIGYIREGSTSCTNSKYLNSPFDNNSSVLSPRGALVGVAPQTKLQVPQIETWSTINHGCFCQFLECQVPPSKRKTPPHKRKPPYWKLSGDSSATVSSLEERWVSCSWKHQIWMFGCWLRLTFV